MGVCCSSATCCRPVLCLYHQGRNPHGAATIVLQRCPVCSRLPRALALCLYRTTTPPPLPPPNTHHSNTRRQLDGMKDTLRTATAPAPAVSAAESKAIAQNDKFLTGQYESQQLVMK